MTDKQIIIDGVDVSGCKKYEHEIVRCNATLKNMCFCGGRCTDKKNADCYYKQLKRAQQELQTKELALNEIEKYLYVQQKYFDGEDYHNLLDIINKAKEI